MSEYKHNVTLVFEGVMLGRFDRKARTYEMGILPTPGHSFSISINDSFSIPPIKELAGFGSRAMGVDFAYSPIAPDNTLWSLGVPDQDPSADLHYEDKAPITTQKPVEGPLPKHRLDYRWVPDVAGERFPNHGEAREGGTDDSSQDAMKTEVPRYDGVFKPVLVITVGMFYAKNLSEILLHNRQGGKGCWGKLGFVPNKICADITLDIGKELVLNAKGAKKDIFRLKAEKGRKYTINFRNAPPAEVEGYNDLSVVDINRPSHFQHLYMLFKVPPEKRYDVRYLPTGTGPNPEECTDEAISKKLEKLINTDLKDFTAEEVEQMRENGLRVPDKVEKSKIGVPSWICAPMGVSSKYPLK